MSHIDTESLLAEAWPEGLPPAELALLRALPDARAEIVRARLAAMLAVEGGAPVGDAAAALGIDRIAFYRLRRRWAKARSLRSLAPFADRKPRRIAAGLASDGEAEAVTVVRAAPPNASARSMSHTMMSRVGGISEPTALRLVRAARMALSADAAHLTRTFGTVLLVDVTGVSLAVDAQDGPMTPVVAIVMDRASRLIFGHAGGSPHDASALQRSALSRASAVVEWQVREGGDDEPPVEVDFVLAEGGEAVVEAVKAAIAPPLLELVAGGTRRFGERLISLTGHRLGRLRLRPRATPSGSRWNGSLSDLSHPPMPMSEAVALIDEAVRDHNRARLAAFDGTDASATAEDPVVVFLRRMSGVVPDGRLASLSATIRRLDEAMAG